MLSIKVLGPGCRNCDEVERIVKKAVAGFGTEAGVEKVRDFREIAKYGVLTTPGLVINGKVVCSGRVPSEAEVIVWLASAASS